MKFDKLIIRKIITNRRQMLRLKCTEFDSRCLSVVSLSGWVIDWVWHYRGMYFADVDV